jgi:hypothetical protein
VTLTPYMKRHEMSIFTRPSVVVLTRKTAEGYEV